MAKNAVLEEKSPLVHRKINKTRVNLDSIHAMTKETDHKVVGTFVNIEAPGLPQKFCLKLYEGMPVFNEVLMDNETVTIPLSVARHINEEFNKEEHSYLQDAKGNSLKTGKRVPRGKFLIEQHLDK